MGYEFTSLLFSGGDPVAGLKDAKGAMKFKIPDMAKALRLCWHKSKLVKLTESLSREIRPVERNLRQTTKTADEALKMIRKARSVSEVKRLEPRIRAMFASIPVDPEKRPLKIWLVGEIYMVIEPEANFNLVELLGEQGVLVTPFSTVHDWMFRSIGAGKRGADGHDAARKRAVPYSPYCLGGEEQLSIGYTVLAKERGYDGVIHLHPFGCMTENSAYPTICRISKDRDIPVLSLSLDEHTESVGYFTRVEAFLELLHQRRNSNGPSEHVQKNS
jgi:predicted nucleotide-binding protein (sugar kinase/HSP70/actin superfamily)